MSFLLRENRRHGTDGHTDRRAGYNTWTQHLMRSPGKGSIINWRKELKTRKPCCCKETARCGCVLCVRVCVGVYWCLCMGFLPDSNKDWLIDWLIDAACFACLQNRADVLSDCSRLLTCTSERARLWRNKSYDFSDSTLFFSTLIYAVYQFVQLHMK